MDEKHLNDLAALAEGRLSDEEREALFESLCRDPDAARILAGMALPEVKWPGTVHLPFPVVAHCRLGICREYFRLFQMEGLRLVDDMGWLPHTIGRVGGTDLPECFPEQIGFQFELSPLEGTFRLSWDRERNELCLSHRLEATRKTDDYVEVWENGALLRASPAATLSDRPLARLQPGATWAIRYRSQPVGIGFRVSPIEFRTRDWLSVCLVHALDGDFEKAKTLLGTTLRESCKDSEILKRISASLEVLSALTTSQAGALVPIPVTRSSSTSFQSKRRLLKPVWTGIANRWPEISSIPNPWEPTERGNTQVDLPPEVLALAESTVQAAKGPIEFSGRENSVEDPYLRTGWTVLHGCCRLISRDFAAALESFRSCEPMTGDPFGLELVLPVAEHLAESERTTDPSAESSDRVWRKVFEPILNAIR